MQEKTSEHPENRKGTPEWRISVIKNLFADEQEEDRVYLKDTKDDSVTISRIDKGYYVYIMKNTESSVLFKRIHFVINTEGEITEVEDVPGEKISASKKKRYTTMFDDELEKSATHLASGIEMEPDIKEETRESSEGIIKRIRKKLKL